MPLPANVIDIDVRDDVDENCRTKYTVDIIQYTLVSGTFWEAHKSFQP